MVERYISITFLNFLLLNDPLRAQFCLTNFFWVHHCGTLSSNLVWASEYFIRFWSGPLWVLQSSWYGYFWKNWVSWFNLWPGLEPTQKGPSPGPLRSTSHTFVSGQSHIFSLHAQPRPYFSHLIDCAVTPILIRISSFTILYLQVCS